MRDKSDCVCRKLNAALCVSKRPSREGVFTNTSDCAGMLERQRMRGQGEKDRTEDRIPVSHGGGGAQPTHNEAQGEWRPNAARVLVRSWSSRCVQKRHVPHLFLVEGEERTGTNEPNATRPLRLTCAANCLEFHAKSGCKSVDQSVQHCPRWR